MTQTEPNNISKYIQTEADINLFVSTIADLWSKAHTEETDDYWAIFPRQSRQLLWIIATYLNENVCPSERTLDSVMKLLGTCVPKTKRDDKTTFDIIIADCPSRDLREKYEYFKHEAFGIHSNCYRETVQLCTEALQELSIDDLIKAIQDTNGHQAQEPSKPKETQKPLFGKFWRCAGQDHQVSQYEKYLTALHEASHAVAHYLLGIPFHGVTIVSTEEYGGMAYAKSTWGREPYHKRAIALYAGAAGELAVLNPVFPRVWPNSSDVNKATKIIKEEVINELSNPRDALQYVFVDADALGLADKESPYIIYETIKRCVAVRQEAIDLITANKDMVAALADELLKKQSMPGEEVIAFLDAWQAQHNAR